MVDSITLVRGLKICRKPILTACYRILMVDGMSSETAVIEPAGTLTLRPKRLPRLAKSAATKERNSLLIARTGGSNGAIVTATTRSRRVGSGTVGPYRVAFVPASGTSLVKNDPIIESRLGENPALPSSQLGHHFDGGAKAPRYLGFVQPLAVGSGEPPNLNDLAFGFLGRVRPASQSNRRIQLAPFHEL